MADEGAKTGAGTGFCPHCGAAGSEAIVRGHAARYMPYLLFTASAMAGISALVKIFAFDAEVATVSFAWIAAAAFMLAGSLWLHYMKQSRRCTKCHKDWILPDA